MSHVFISYSRRDFDFVTRIVQALEAEGFDTWFDKHDIPHGEDWEQEILRGIQGADAFLFLTSPHSVASEMCNKEIGYAVANGKRILPIFIANVEDKDVYPSLDGFRQPKAKEEIARRNFIFCRDGRDDFDKAIAEIKKTIETDYDWLKFHRALQVKAISWEQKKDLSRLLRGRELRESESKIAAGMGKDPPLTDLQRLYISKSKTFNKTFNIAVTITAVTIAVLAALPGLTMPRAIPGQWVPIAAGEFTMGMNREEAETYEYLCKDFYKWIGESDDSCSTVDDLLKSSGRLTHTELTDFKIMSNEVTNALYMQCVDAGECNPPNGWKYESVDINKPATGLNWQEATTYCTWLNGRLPTEGEWEKAARGPHGTLFPWGNDWDRLHPNANLENLKDESPLPITAYTASDTNAFGVFNMAGNVMEWTASESTPHIKGDAFVNEVVQWKDIESKPVRRVVARGGAWGNPSASGMASKRGPIPPALRDANIGFRCACPAGQACEEPWDWKWIWSHDYYPDQ